MAFAVKFLFTAEFAKKCRKARKEDQSLQIEDCVGIMMNLAE
jgi:hypothetical protein